MVVWTVVDMPNTEWANRPLWNVCRVSVSRAGTAWTSTQKEPLGQTKYFFASEMWDWIGSEDFFKVKKDRYQRVASVFFVRYG